MKRIVVTGGRNYEDFAMIDDVLTSLNPQEIYVGDANGVDLMTIEWAKMHNIPYKIFKADWLKYGKSAGPIRNRIMLSEAGLDSIVIAFPGGFGTLNCRKQALEKNMIILKVEE